MNKTLTGLESNVSAQAARIDLHAAELSKIETIQADIGGMRGDIRTLNKNVMATLRSDANQEQSLGALKAEVQAAGASAGGKRGALAAGGITGIVFAIWAILYIVSIVNGSEPPPAPISLP